MEFDEKTKIEKRRYGITWMELSFYLFQGNSDSLNRSLD